MIDRMAVLICGEFRTWDKSKQYIFDYAESKANTVDYYFSTWDKTTNTYRYLITPENLQNLSSPVTLEDVASTFSDRNLINVKLSDQSNFKNYTALTDYYRSYLAKIANTMKRRHEYDHNFTYDQVLEIRPDLFIRPRVNYPPVRDCNTFEYYSGNIYINNSTAYDQINDFYYQSSSFGNDVISDRFNYTSTLIVNKLLKTHSSFSLSNHWVILDYFYHRRLQKINDTDIKFSAPFRDNFPDQNLLEKNDSEIAELGRTWIENKWREFRDK
jgi:hypothetical protein